MSGPPLIGPGRLPRCFQEWAPFLLEAPWVGPNLCDIPTNFQLDKYVAASILGVFQLYIMKGHNTCAWLRVAEERLCGRSCCQKYCKVHLAIIRKGRKISVPCRICGRGVQSEIELCQGCGRGKVWLRHARLEKKARSIYAGVMSQLLHNLPPI